MTTNDIDAIRARVEAVERVEDGGNPSKMWEFDDCGNFYAVSDGNGNLIANQVIWMEDAAFIAAARTDVPLLCDEVDALRGELARAREVIADIASSDSGDLPRGLDENGFEWMPSVRYQRIREYAATYLRDAGRGGGE